MRHGAWKQFLLILQNHKFKKKMDDLIGASSIIFPALYIRIFSRMLQLIKVHFKTILFSRCKIPRIKRHQPQSSDFVISVSFSLSVWSKTGLFFLT